ncbi:hypothetical protein HON71_01435 [Candidatus Woesearchaeota archaeon]|jgi:hypothetical protein|nr:hypothetical protein [Candidatus Woesearchaeota archaeon]MBT5342783.1 hypothetical protein [Candidatus Woesearchaeota archaeon]
MKKIILLLSLLVIAMFLVGCVETAEETVDVVDDDEALTGAARFQKSTPKVSKVSTEPDYELVYNNLALEKGKKYRIYYVSGEPFKNMPSFVGPELYETYTQNQAPDVYPGGKYSFDIIYIKEHNYVSSDKWWGCSLYIDGKQYDLDMNEHNIFNINGRKVAINVYGSNIEGSCLLNYFAPIFN